MTLDIAALQNALAPTTAVGAVGDQMFPDAPVTPPPPPVGPAGVTPSQPNTSQTALPLEDVVTPTGGTIKVMGLAEKMRYEQARQSYTEGIEYTLRSDIEDLERLLFLELMVYRWGLWLMQGQDYDGLLLRDDNQLRRMVQDFTKQIDVVKDGLKLTRKAREGDKGDSFDERWRQLAAHAKEFGIMREKQLGRSLEIMQTIFATVSTFDRADEEERKKLGMPEVNSVLDLIRELRPHFDEVDTYFKQNSQKMWVRNP